MKMNFDILIGARFFILPEIQMQMNNLFDEKLRMLQCTKIGKNVYRIVNAC